jgi:hypothetical protein
MVCFAKPIIREYGNNVRVYKLSQTTTVDVRYTLKKKPFVAVLDSSDFNIIQVTYLLQAGLIQDTHFRIMSKEEANNINSGVCISLATEPHFEGVRSPFRPMTTPLDREH